MPTKEYLLLILQPWNRMFHQTTGTVSVHHIDELFLAVHPLLVYHYAIHTYISDYYMKTLKCKPLAKLGLAFAICVVHVESVHVQYQSETRYNKNVFRMCSSLEANAFVAGDERVCLQRQTHLLPETNAFIN